MTHTAKHTPGPWQISAIQNEPEKISIIDADMCFVAEVWQTYINGESRQQAHATLIAAAPELLAALNAASEWLNDMGCEHEEPDLTCVVCLVNAAINKAEGR